MRINKEGYRIILFAGIIYLLFWSVFYYMVRHNENQLMFWAGTLLIFFMWFFVVAFFREPRRVKIHDKDLLFSPCDGRVVVTELVNEDEYLNEKMMQVSIFMSVTNVHMNWVPMEGEVEYFKYHPGKFLVAWHPKSSTENERTTTVVRSADGVKVLFRQVAGILARRIVSYMKVGAVVDQNSVAGFIKFGSRIDLLIPADSYLLVDIGDKVIGSQTPIARLRRLKTK